MKTKVSPAIVGSFVLGALALAVIALLSFGGVNFVSQPLRFVVTFNESINGLDVGSPVKMRGVRVGRVVDLDVRYDAANNRSQVRVECELTRIRLSGADGVELKVSNREELEKLVDGGLRAQLGLLGLATGLLFVELDFYPPNQVAAAVAAPDSRYAVVPAVPSTISEFTNNVTGILTDINGIDFAGLGRELEGLIADSRRQLNRIDLPALSDQWLRTGASIDSLVNSREVQNLLANLNDAAGRLNTTLAEVNRQVQANGDELQSALQEAQTAVKSFNDTATTITRFVNTQRGVGDDVAAALRQVSDAAAAMQRLAEYLERNPNALILGRRPSN